MIVSVAEILIKLPIGQGCLSPALNLEMDDDDDATEVR